ncbi:hypothetical protein TERTU_1719 [Teredinibacter turnerae T7901]|uniref:Uncharacterized protein n=1 Tax=Teredinibacter turnerae (strain ATCC 39867 / T7901) TaxID=377629 RepID=C5BU59_TERTT|nr:hypothetical protein TERTU_1719 [Teredinibacter turnerae T7901]
MMIRLTRARILTRFIHDVTSDCNFIKNTDIFLYFSIA